jgi:L-alanine-DL-glutamate epimerase-like enolase superfamily enzyme
MEMLTSPFKNGHYYPPQKPGLGFEIPPATLRRYVPSLAD